MFVRPLELDSLSTEKVFLFGELDRLIADRGIMADIAKLVGYDLSLKGAFQCVGFGNIDYVSADTIRKRLATEVPVALETFEKLISVSQEYNRKNNPLISY